MENNLTNTVLIGKQIEKLPSCHSTNSFLMQKFKDCQVNEGFLVLADYQEAGKGQRGNVWVSDAEKNLLFSFLIKPTFLALTDQFKLNVFVSLAVAKTLKEVGLEEVKVKWPNDIYVKGKKIAGILIENIVKSGELTESIVGVGLNVNQLTFENLPHATSVSAELKCSIDKGELMAKLCNNFTFYYRLLKMDRARLMKGYHELLFGLHEKRKFKTDTICEGEIVGINENGELMIEHADGMVCYGFKEVEFIL